MGFRAFGVGQLRIDVFRRRPIERDVLHRRQVRPWYRGQDPRRFKTDGTEGIAE